MAKQYSRIYNSWSSMKSRCNNPNHHNYSYWGGRGISYDTNWESFKGFENDMLPSYKEGLSLERIDNNKGYSKENCRWATQIEQTNNTRRNRFISYKGNIKTLSQWIRELDLKASTVRQRYYVYHWDINKCFTQ